MALASAALLLLLSFSAGTAYRSEDELLIHEVTDHLPAATLPATEERFRSFMGVHGKEYGSREEYLRKLGVFARNLSWAAEHQLLDPTAEHGITPFSDLTAEEFERMMGLTGAAPPAAAAEYPQAPVLAAEGLPENFDWREKGAVTDPDCDIAQELLQSPFCAPRKTGGDHSRVVLGFAPQQIRGTKG
ncbi:hypothetical protein KSP40_PGU010292 [Platanthera guangdongensis]|uniref:Cathepsin propeptide inhibitor domain-containing protein n=1 Tax=Platanthera guangdongensis TaxID=2320717 RepID=A0ABR2LT47_9ASPA